jgi:hypothetical protein
MPKLNAQWHGQNPMLAKATLEQRVESHLRHASARGFREIPQTVLAELKRRRTRIPQRSTRTNR